MKKILLIGLGLSLLLGTSSLFAQGDASLIKKGQKVYLKKIKSKCQMTGAKMAIKHTSGEWTKIYNDGKLNSELKNQCPKFKKDLKPKYQKQLFEFLNEYGSDTGNFPSCG